MEGGLLMLVPMLDGVPFCDLHSLRIHRAKGAMLERRSMRESLPSRLPFMALAGDGKSLGPPHPVHRTPFMLVHFHRHYCTAPCGLGTTRDRIASVRCGHPVMPVPR